MTRRGPFADQQDDFADEDLEPTREGVARAFAEHVLLLNAERTSSYRVAATRAFDAAKERFRRADGELPQPGEDRLLDRMRTVMAELESSPEALRSAAMEIPGSR
ncbi:MAG TPA: hypothetical protein VGT60_06260 [Candidatus Limnocylindria bacterium]|nr:hypothetical protein [Candidatus Limnocylindria bacterium]